MRSNLLRQLVIASIALLALQTQAAHAASDKGLVANCRVVLAATEPAHRVWLEKDLFAYEMRAAVGTSRSEMRVYRENLADTCTRVAHNNEVRKARRHMQVTARRQLATQKHSHRRM